MMDKQHCFMNALDEHEYALFYDFAKLFPNQINQVQE